MHIAFQLKKLLKKLVGFLQHFLPRSIFEKMYAFMFPIYSFMLRKIYSLKALKYYLSGDKDGVIMVRRIYKIMPYTLVGAGGLEATYKLAKMMNDHGIEGNFVELGVARGGCAALMATIAFENNNSSRKLWLFDSFAGLPSPTDEDFSGDQTGDHVRPLVKGSCLGMIEEVKKLMFEKFSFPKEGIFFIKGWFSDTLPIKGKDIGKIAVLRVDADWYESTKCCLEHLYGQVASRGAVIIDDYQSCFGCKKAVDEFLNTCNINVKLNLDGRGGCYFIKP